MARTTKAEREQIERIVRDMLEQRKKPGQIKRAIADHFNLSPRSVERYINRARDEMIADTGQPSSHHRADAHAFYLSIVLNTNVSAKERLHAQELIDKLLCLRMPLQKVAPKLGVDLTLQQLQELTNDELSTLFDKLDAACNSG